MATPRLTSRLSVPTSHEFGLAFCSLLWEWQDGWLVWCSQNAETLWWCSPEILQRPAVLRSLGVCIGDSRCSLPCVLTWSSSYRQGSGLPVIENSLLTSKSDKELQNKCIYCLSNYLEISVHKGFLICSNRHCLESHTRASSQICSTDLHCHKLAGDSHVLKSPEKPSVDDLWDPYFCLCLAGLAFLPDKSSNANPAPVYFRGFLSLHCSFLQLENYQEHRKQLKEKIISEVLRRFIPTFQVNSQKGKEDQSHVASP